MPPEPLVAILLSTYNGERYVAAQIDSLLRQTHQNMKIVVRDDGSSDSTLEILARYSDRRAIFDIARGRNLGVAASFLELIELAPQDADYFAFSDQDDVWKEDKLARAVRFLKANEGQVPAVYFTNVEIVDEKLRSLATEGDRAPRGASFENAIVQNVATGCTMVFNASAFKALRGRSPRSSEIVMHDWWVYQVVAALGVVVYDPYPSVKYRQHGANVVGMAGGLKPWLDRVLRHLRRSSTPVRRQAGELLRVYGDELIEERRSVLEQFLRCIGSENFLERAQYACRTPTYRQFRLDDLLLKFLITVGRL